MGKKHKGKGKVDPKPSDASQPTLQAVEGAAASSTATGLQPTATACGQASESKHAALQGAGDAAFAIPRKKSQEPETSAPKKKAKKKPPVSTLESTEPSQTPEKEVAPQLTEAHRKEEPARQAQISTEEKISEPIQQAEKGAAPVEIGEPEKTSGKKKKKAKAKSSSVSSQEEIITKLAGISLDTRSYEPELELAKRPKERGRMGKPIALVVNYFVLTYEHAPFIYHYDVDICEADKSQKKGRSLMSEGMTAKQAIEKKIMHVELQQKRSIGKAKCREIIGNMMQSHQLRAYGPVYDGQKNIYTSKPFPFEGTKEYKVEITVEEKTRTYFVILQAVDKGDVQLKKSIKKKSDAPRKANNFISLEPLQDVLAGRSTDVPQEILTVMETIMAHREPPFTEVRVRSSFFPLAQTERFGLGSGLELWFGLNQNVHLTERGPVIVINVAAKPFYKAGSVIEFAREVLNYDIRKEVSMRNSDIRTLEEALRGVRVQVTHQRQPRKYLVKAVTTQAAKDIEQKIDGKSTSVAGYFAQKYKPLSYPNLPCLTMQSSNVTHIPIEVCMVCQNQPKMGVLDELFSGAAATMIRRTAIDPVRRFADIDKAANTVSKLSGQSMRDFGLFMNVKPMELNGRVLIAPSLSYEGSSQSRPVMPDPRGVWRMDGKKFYRTQVINKWILINFVQSTNNATLEQFASCLAVSGSKLGMRMNNYKIRSVSNREKTEDILRYAKLQEQVDLAVIVVDRRGPHRYEEIKFISDFKLNLVTQCVSPNVVRRVDERNDQITNNICLKLNLKLGGINHTLQQRPQVFREPCIVFGADAIHWTRGFGYPSIAAVVGSLDPFPSKYALTCRVQKNEDDSKISQEIILKMEDMVTELLVKFQETNKLYPKRIIFFRDGVSEGQFKTAHQMEVSSIQKACKALIGKYVPITYIIVQKRHQTRFRPKFTRDGVGKMGNIPAGTVVDTDVVHPVYFDYFLCSHEGIQGTSKPAHYTVLHDDNYLTADELQQLSYHLCHMYGRCNRSISLPAPVCYADLACTRAKNYADIFASKKQGSVSEEVLNAINSMKSFPNNMFYI